MKKIFKYPIEVTDCQVLTLPAEAEILTVQVQDGTPCLWAMVDTQATEAEEIKIRIIGTGHNIPDADDLSYINTFQMSGGRLVFHVFKVEK
ncbi:MAG: hypothetical protein LIP01_02085 [Tannerellaceae bacterium]|nr:hypothetical protein [Tannerellaceae bacterium]